MLRYQADCIYFKLRPLYAMKKGLSTLRRLLSNVFYYVFLISVFALILQQSKLNIHIGFNQANRAIGWEGTIKIYLYMQYNLKLGSQNKKYFLLIPYNVYLPQNGTLRYRRNFENILLWCSSFSCYQKIPYCQQKCLMMTWGKQKECDVNIPVFTLMTLPLKTVRLYLDVEVKEGKSLGPQASTLLVALTRMLINNP